eukprot:945421-Prorocentrum_minimum.AAC.1
MLTIPSLCQESGEFAEMVQNLRSFMMASDTPPPFEGEAEEVEAPQTPIDEEEEEAALKVGCPLVRYALLQSGYVSVTLAPRSSAV